MRKCYLIEDKLPPKLPVIFSAKISKQIKAIYAKNQDNAEAISQWDKYIDGIKGYISNPVIALDYTNRFQRLPRGGRFIRGICK